MSNKIKPWYDVYSGNLEYDLFVILSRDPNNLDKKRTWRTAKGLAKELNCNVTKVEAIFEKYVGDQIRQEKKDPSLFAYFENVDQKKKAKPIAELDKEARVNNAYGQPVAATP